MSHCFVCLTSGNLLQCYFQERCVYNRKHTGIVLCTTFYLVHTLTLISSCALNNVIIPPLNKVKGVYRNHSVCPSVFLSVCADSCLAHNFCLVWHCIIIRWCRVHSWSRYDLELWPQGQIYTVFDMFSCPAHIFFGLTKKNRTLLYIKIFLYIVGTIFYKTFILGNFSDRYNLWK